MHSNLHQAQSHDILRSWQSQRHDVNHHRDFVLPLFIGNDDEAAETIDSMPAVFRYGCNTAIDYLEPLVNLHGLSAVLLFPVVTKQSSARGGHQTDGAESSDESAGLSSSGSSSQSRRSLSSEDGSSESSSEPDGDGCRPERGPSAPGSIGPDNSNTASRNNPFLNQNEETENLLDNQAEDQPVEALGENGQRAQHQQHRQQSVGSWLPVANKAERPQASKIASSETSGFRVSQANDIKLIKAMALQDKHNPVLRLIPRLRAKFPGLLIICDVCLCAFTSTGHCCLFEDHTRAKGGPAASSGHLPISNKLTCQYLAMLAVEYAKRGCDVVAPSDMMDGRIQTIREKLNDCGLHHISLLSYSAKFASAFYGPFRQATDNAPEFGDRRAYQLPPGSRALALRAVQRDIDQGADFVMVKPAGAYLDMVRDIKNKHPEVPIAVYQVSGEYSMLMMAAKNGLIDLDRAINETLTSFRRAGASIIITYFTPDILQNLTKNRNRN